MLLPLHYFMLHCEATLCTHDQCLKLKQRSAWKPQLYLSSLPFSLPSPAPMPDPEPPIGKGNPPLSISLPSSSPFLLPLEVGPLNTSRGLGVL